jgi:Na+-driven multidrug efflux pump
MLAYTGSFRGAGKTLTAAAISVLTLGVIRFPIAWITAGPLGEVGIWLSFAVSNVAGAIIALAWYRRGTWRESELAESKVELTETSVETPGCD